MRLSGILMVLLVLIIFSANTYGEEIPLKLNQKEVDISGKMERYYSLFPDPPSEIKIQGPAKLKITVRKIIDKKNPLTKLPVTFSVNLGEKKVKEILLNDREGTAVIKDATMFNAGTENSFELEVPQGEQIIKMSVTKSAIKGLLIRVEKVGEEKPSVAAAPVPEKDKKKEAEFVPPIIPPLAPLVPLAEKSSDEPRSPTLPQPAEKKLEEKKTEVAPKETPRPAPTQTIAKYEETPPVTQGASHKKKGFGDIVLLSVKGGTILPLEYGNPGGFGEFSTSFGIYRGVMAGISVASYNINRDYIINDPNTGNAVLKYHLHGVPLSAFFGYKHQMHNILAKFELGSGVNMVDIDIRRKNTAEKTDTINSFQINTAAELGYITKYGSLGMGIRYLYSISDNADKDNGFASNINSGGLIITTCYNYGF